MKHAEVQYKEAEKCTHEEKHTLVIGNYKKTSPKYTTKNAKSVPTKKSAPY